MLLGVEVDNKLLVDVLRNLCPDRSVEELASKGLGIELEPGVLGRGCDAVLDDLKALGALAHGEK